MQKHQGWTWWKHANEIISKVFLPVLPQGTRNFLGTSSSDRNNGSKQLTASGRSCARCMSSLGSCDAGCRRSKQAPSVFWLRSNLERWVPSGWPKQVLWLLWNAVKCCEGWDHYGPSSLIQQFYLCILCSSVYFVPCGRRWTESFQDFLQAVIALL
jgi:hypothetical protein